MQAVAKDDLICVSVDLSLMRENVVLRRVCCVGSSHEGSVGTASL